MKMSLYQVQTQGGSEALHQLPDDKLKLSLFFIKYISNDFIEHNRMWTISFMHFPPVEVYK